MVDGNQATHGSVCIYDTGEVTQHQIKLVKDVTLHLPWPPEAASLFL